MKERKGSLLLCLLLLALIGCAKTATTSPSPILLFNGTGTSPNDVAAIEKVLRDRGLAYETANSEQLNELSEPALMRYRLIVFPGGNYLTMGDHLHVETTERIRSAVHLGVNYLGICAGGLLAGKAECHCLNLTSGVQFGFYGVVDQNIHKAIVPIDCADKPIIEHYWEDGPQFTNWGQVVGKYPDGTPAIVQDAVGKGWVVLCGVHPEAPTSWRRGLASTTPIRASQDYAATLIEAALNGRPLPHF